MTKRNTWIYIYGDEFDEIWEHFDMNERSPTDRLVLSFKDYKTEDEIKEKE